MPVLFVLVSAGHSSVRLGGQVMVGGVVSRTVIVCTQLVLFPQWSLAVQVREMTFVPPQPVTTLSLKLTVTTPQSSCAAATPVAFVVVLAGHSRTRSGGQVIVGGLTSTSATSMLQLLTQVLLVTLSIKL